MTATEPRPVSDLAVDAAAALQSRAWTIAAAQMARMPALVDVEDGPSLEPDWRETRWCQAIPNRFRWARIDGVSPSWPGHRDLVSWASPPPGPPEHRRPPPNLVLAGPTGTGKTWAAVAAAREHFDRGAEVSFWPVVELLDALRPSGTGDPELWARVVHETDVLILDDVGAHKATDWTDERLYAIVNRRWLDERPTVATTNVPPDALAEVIGDRMFSRLLGDGATVLIMGGDDRRFAT